MVYQARILKKNSMNHGKYASSSRRNKYLGAIEYERF